MAEQNSESIAKLNKIRSNIDKIDKQLIELLRQRSLCVQEIAEIKCQNQLPIYDGNREKRILEEKTSNNPTKYQAVDLANIFHAIMRAGLNQQLLYRSEHEE
ncbi:MAG: chorismate mutase [Kangiellaceae bacterium]|nr:chorismate mutase [Kangiellaceae bacterium]MCW8997897.1 chorismate mutase [Kangiellaceae bacterium]